jgi:dephospho-CoA kinase
MAKSRRAPRRKSAAKPKLKSKSKRPVAKKSRTGRVRTRTIRRKRLAPTLLVGLTGGIASGKSAVATLFAQLGVPVLDTDQIARDVVEPDTPTLRAIVAAFGNGILDPEGRLDRARMRDRVFADDTQRKRLEAIIHPAIRAELARRSSTAGGAYQVHVIPLLVERSRADAYDRVLVVDCPVEDQATRLMARDGSNAVQVRQILDAQASREARLAVADDLIVNTGTLDDLRGFVATLHKNYSSIARNRKASKNLRTDRARIRKRS